MQCCLNGVNIMEVPKFLAESPSVTTYAIEWIDPFSAVHLLVNPLQLSSMAGYFDVNSPMVTEYGKEVIPKINLTAEEPPWNQSTNEFS